VKKLILVALLLAACSKKSAPVIQSFTADKSEITAGDSVTFTFAVGGATRITLLPAPGVVTASPVTVAPTGTTTYTLRAENDVGAVSQDLLVTVKPPVTPARIASFNALPSQVAAGKQVTLSWSVTNAASIKISDGSANPPTDVSSATSTVVTPTATTTYTLTVTALPGTTPATVTATAVARVAAPATINSFTASSSAINQGDTITLSWDGTATSWSLSDGTTTTNYGPLKTATFEPAPPSVTYTLTATGLGGNATATRSITVTPQPGTKLVYTAPTVASQALQLVADPCGACTSIILRLVATGTLSLRGVALDLPLDAAKVSLDPATFAAPFVTGANPAAMAVLGNGPLKNTLVLGAGLKGNGTAVAGDVSATEVAHFTLALVPAGGKGVVFDGATLASNPAFKAVIRSAGTAAGIAVGKLVVL
jgi:hypothetical protein